MGSFASGLHVRSGNSKSVADSITAILVEAGWRPTEEVPTRDGAWVGSPTLRAVQISAPHRGWVSLLDSDFGGAHALTSKLAERLKTHAIFFFVDDSDSWSYLLANPDGDVSEFESSGGADDDEELENLVAAGPAIAKIQALMSGGGFQQKMQEIQAQMAADAPTEIRDAQTRLRSGQGSPADMQQYQAWAMREMPKYMADMKALLGEVLHPPKSSAKTKSKRRTSKAERAAQNQRLDALRPILATGVTDEEVQSVLNERALFAEELLGKFLPLLDLPAYYANLSYRYLAGCSPQELADQGIRFVQQLCFESA